MSSEYIPSPAAIAMDEAIELDIAENGSPYPHRATFLNADWPRLADEIARAGDEGRAVVLCYADGTRRILEVRSPAQRAEPLAS